MNVWDMVKEFHTVNGQPIGFEPRGFIDDETQVLRLRLINEELEELEEAMGEQNVVEIADALADLVYVIYGTAIT